LRGTVEALADTILRWSPVMFIPASGTKGGGWRPPTLTS